MYSQKQIDILNFIDDYLENTPPNQLKTQLQKISAMSFAGTSAREYFDNFHNYHQDILGILKDLEDKKTDFVFENDIKFKNETTTVDFINEPTYIGIFENTKTLSNEIEPGNYKFVMAA
ncbi:MAG: hypothetical protein RLZZ292_3184 [Bacteroidota bacterium]|jgi:hypothetical protein